METGKDYLKFVVVGDGTVGKTCLLWRYAKGEFPKDYVPTVFENYTFTVDLNGRPQQVQLWDTAGQEELATIRTFSYPNTDVFLLCFSVADRSSFNNVQTKWVKELKTYAKDNSKIVLVGTKNDLRSEEEDCLSKEDGEVLAHDIEAVQYVECSALNNEGVKQVFDTCIQAGLTRPEESGGCCLVY